MVRHQQPHGQGPLGQGIRVPLHGRGSQRGPLPTGGSTAGHRRRAAVAVAGMQASMTLPFAPSVYLAGLLCLIAGCASDPAASDGTVPAGSGGAPFHDGSAAGGDVATGGAGGSPASGGAPGSGGTGGSTTGSHGGTITFQGIGATGWFPSRRDPASGQCDAYHNGECCMTKFQIDNDQLTPWDEDLIMTLRGPMVVKQLVVYEPAAAQPNGWQIVSTWDARTASAPQGIAFDGNKTETAGFSGVVGNQCLVDVMTDREFPCGPGSVPYCPPVSA